MAKPIPPQQVEQCYLKNWDPDGDTWVKIKTANTGAHAERQDHFNRAVFETDGQRVRQIQDWSASDLIIKECWLTFAGTNLTWEEPPAEDAPYATPLLRPGMDFEAFRSAFGQLPDELAEEWHAHVLRLNPKWSTLR